MEKKMVLKPKDIIFFIIPNLRSKQLRKINFTKLKFMKF